jgi:hypothetical protein
VSRVLSGSGCPRLLASDGITSSQFEIKNVPGVLGTISLDFKLARKNMPAIGQAASIAKNLDEYQFRICSLVPSLPDSDPRKLLLQKYRVASIAAFAALSSILKEPAQESLEKWNASAGPLMEETSEAYVKATSNSNLQITSRKDVFEFFKVPEDEIDAALANFYG